MKPVVIAEAGVNHNGDLAIACRLVDAAAAAGADYVKFQTFRADLVATAAAPKADYQVLWTGGSESQLAMLKRLELDADAHRVLIQRCLQRGIAFLSTPFDEESLELLDELGVERFKVSSGDLTNIPLLRQVAAKGKPVILSTGMATLGEVEMAVRALQEGGAGSITLLHCVTQYPAPPEQINLRAMETMRRAFSLPVGYSDHTAGIEIALAAVALGAVIVEKHFTLDRSLPGPDHHASLEPGELAAMVRGIHAVHAALGTGVKAPALCEEDNRVVVRKSLVARRQLKAGEVLTAADIVIKRPGTGLPPSALDWAIGRTLRSDVAVGDVIRETVL